MIDWNGNEKQIRKTHDMDCPCYHRINSGHPMIVMRRDHEVK